MFLLLVLSLQLPPRTLLHSLLPQATPSSQECFSYLYSCRDSWQFYSESQDSCNLEQAAGWEEELGSPSLNWEEGGSYQAATLKNYQLAALTIKAVQPSLW